ncbi:MAG TPA: hypothetical protein VIM67_01775 [Terriglobus sp.]
MREDGMEAANQHISELASQPTVTVEEQPRLIVATAEENAIAELDRRIRELETAIGDLRSVKASAATGRKTSASVMAKGTENADVDEAFRSLSVEQRIAVKSGLIRAGLL